MNVWAGILADRIIRPHVFPGLLTGNMYSALKFLEWTLPELLEDVPFDIRRRM